MFAIIAIILLLKEKFKKIKGVKINNCSSAYAVWVEDNEI